MCQAVPHNEVSGLWLHGTGIWRKPVSIAPFDASMLTTIIVQSVQLDTSTVCFLASLTHVTCLDLTDSFVPTKLQLAALAQLVCSWRDRPEGSSLAKLILDGCHRLSVRPCEFSPLLDAMGGPDDIERISPVSCADSKVFLSCNLLGESGWEESMQLKKDYEPLKVRLRLLSDAETLPAPVVPPSDPPPSGATSSSVGVANANGMVHSHYADAKREMDRGMFGWFDYTCRGCGTTWATNSVTVSFRQTAVSECLRNKRACASRPEHARMLAGEKQRGERPFSATRRRCVLCSARPARWRRPIARAVQVVSS